MHLCRLLCRATRSDDVSLLPSRNLGFGSLACRFRECPLLPPLCCCGSCGCLLRSPVAGPCQRSPCVGLLHAGRRQDLPLRGAWRPACSEYCPTSFVSHLCLPTSCPLCVAVDMGFTLRDLVALSAAHTLGAVNGRAMTPTPQAFDGSGACVCWWCGAPCAIHAAGAGSCQLSPIWSPPSHAAAPALPIHPPHSPTCCAQPTHASCSCPAADYFQLVSLDSLSLDQAHHTPPPPTPPPPPPPPRPPRPTSSRFPGARPPSLPATP